MATLQELQNRFRSELQRYETAEGTWRFRWIVLEGIVLLIGLLTPVIVIFRKSGLYPVEFWVWWCIITPLLVAGCVIIMRVTGVQDKCLTNRRRIRRVSHLLRQSEVEIPLTKDEARTNELVRAWNEELSKIEFDY